MVRTLGMCFSHFYKKCPLDNIIEVSSSIPSGIPSLIVFSRGSAIARIIGNNVKGGDTEFHPTVNMYVYEEEFEGQKLSEIINKEHENRKYLPGVKLPENVVSFLLALIDHCLYAERIS